MRKDVLAAIHTGHLGIAKSKARARQSVYWPQMNAEIEKLISNCDICISLQDSKAKDPLLIPPLPTRPWEIVGCDLFQYGGHHYLIITDYYSLYPEVYLLKSEEAEDTIDKRCVCSSWDTCYSYIR